MIEFHYKIMVLLNEGWIKKKKNNYYIFLEKDNIQLKVSLNSGSIISQLNIEN
jgi:hypothetical protein